jgi:hypothetical protein
MTEPVTPAPSDQPQAPASHRREPARTSRPRRLVLGALLLVALAVGGVFIYRAHSGLDAHAQAACDAVTKVNGGTGGLFDGAILEITAIGPARQSSDSELQAAGNSKPVGANELNSPLYVNPGDYAYAKVAQWCAVHA